MKKITAILSSVVFAAAFIIAPTTFASTVGSTFVTETEHQAVHAVNTASYAEQVVELVNNERRSRGIREIRTFPLLAQAANIRANEIIQKWDHTRPDGRSCFTVISDLGIKSTARGENIGMGYGSPSAVVQGWMESDGHRANILNGNFNYIGVGCVDHNGVLYWTQEFIGSNEDIAGAYLPSQGGGRSCDLNGDGITDAVDASMVLADYAAVSARKSARLDQNQRSRADMNGDSIVDAVDASIVLSIYAANSAR